MIVSDLFEATTEIPIASGVVNPATGRVWLPSELAASRARRAAKNIQQAKLATATQVARDEMDNPPAAATPAAIPTATSSTAPAPSSVPRTPTVPTVPNMTKSPAAPAKAKTGGRVAGAPLSQTPNAVRKRAARAAATTPVTEPNSMDNMSRQLAARGQAQTSTGGATIATGTGVRHAASPTNPNQTTAGTPTTLTPVNTGMQDIINRLTSQIRTIKNKDDLKKIKQNIDREFTRKGVVSESAFIKRDILVKRAHAQLARVLK